MNPANYQPPFYMAMVYRKMGDWEKSQDLIRKIISKDPRDAIVLINIGSSYTYMHSYDTALAFFQKAADVMPGWPGPYTTMIEAILLKTGNTARAWEVLDTAVIRTGDRLQYYRIMLNVYEGRYRDALSEVQSSTDDDFDFPGLRFLTYGLVYGVIGNEQMTRSYYDSALYLFKTLIMANPEDCYSYSCCGLAYAGLGNATDAVIAGKTAVQMASDDNLIKSDMIINLAKIYSMTGDFKNAAEQVEYLISNPSWFSVKLLNIDPSLEKLSLSPEFKAITKSK
jgi:tetratricopeptide (TPR) repeat protein